ncbi:MAG: DUF971 domain-containing protein [Mariprofundaceae bacterium]
MPDPVSTAMPTAIRNMRKDGRLEIDWDDGHHSIYSHEYLRVECPCAGCRGHTPDQAKAITGKENVRATRIELAGNYAIRIEFDDGHGTGLYIFSKLRNEMCQCPDCLAQ